MEPNQKKTSKEVERRAAKARTKAGIFKNAKIAVLKEDTLQGKVNLFLFKKLITITKSVHFINSPHENLENYDFVFIPETSDQKAENLLSSMLKSKKTKEPPRSVRLLGESTMKETEKYAKEKNIPFTLPQKTSDEQDFIQKTEEKYSGTVHSLAKASDELKNFLNKP